jgi:hypothetical protein
MTASLALVNFNSKKVETIQAEAALRCSGYKEAAGIGAVLGSILCPQCRRIRNVSFQLKLPVTMAYNRGNQAVAVLSAIPKQCFSYQI